MKLCTSSYMSMTLCSLPLFEPPALDHYNPLAWVRNFTTFWRLLLSVTRMDCFFSNDSTPWISWSALVCWTTSLVWHRLVHKPRSPVMVPLSTTPLSTTVLPVLFSISPSPGPTLRMLSNMFVSTCMILESRIWALWNILRYLQGTVDYGLHLWRSSNHELVVSINVDWARRSDTRRSNFGYVAFLRANIISSKRQPMVSRSSVEAEYQAVTNGVGDESGNLNC
jgi:hypothetical protein